MNVGGKVTSGGTTVIGQDQDQIGGGFVADQAFVGTVTELNVWGTVLSKSDIVAQASNCHITQGSVNWWSQFKAGVHGGVIICEPDDPLCVPQKTTMSDIQTNGDKTMITVLHINEY